MRPPRLCYWHAPIGRWVPLDEDKVRRTLAARFQHAPDGTVRVLCGLLDGQTMAYGNSRFKIT